MHGICRVLQILLSHPGKLKTKVDLNVLCIFSYVAFWVLVPISADTLYLKYIPTCFFFIYMLHTNFQVFCKINITRFVVLSLWFRNAGSHNFERTKFKKKKKVLLDHHLKLIIELWAEQTIINSWWGNFAKDILVSWFSN